MLPWNIPRLGGAAFCVLCGGFQVLHLAWCSGHHPFDDWLVVSTPLKNMKVSSGYYSQCMEKNVPNHHDQTNGQFHTIPFFGKKTKDIFQPCMPC